MTPCKLAILFAALFILLVATLIFRDRQGTMGRIGYSRYGNPHSGEKLITYAAPKPPMAVIRYGPDNEPYAMAEREWKRWREPEVHTCIPGVDPFPCGCWEKVNGEWRRCE